MSGRVVKKPVKFSFDEKHVLMSQRKDKSLSKKDQRTRQALSREKRKQKKNLQEKENQNEMENKKEKENQKDKEKREENVRKEKSGEKKKVQSKKSEIKISKKGKYSK